MKPNVNENPTAKSSLSKSMKKSTKSRSKVSKSNHNNNASQTAATPQVNPQEPSTSATTPELSKEKIISNRYAGFSAKSIKMFWEQYNTSDIDVMPDVFTRLAEDTTYKVWEFANNIKTYARHSGGKITYDLVNEVLKDCDVTPVLGSGDFDWDRIDYDETCFYDSDKILELRDEYLKEFETKTENKPEILESWVMDKKYSKPLFEFASSLNKGIFLGDSEAFKFAIDTAAFAAQIGCCLRLLLRKCIEILVFDQKIGIIERCLKYLQALSFNPSSREVECRQQLFHLSEILVCLLLDSFDSVQPNNIKLEESHQQPKLERREESFELVKNFLENSDSDIKKKVEALNRMDEDDMRSEYEALFQMMERDGFQERNENFEEMTNVEDIKATVDINSGETKLEPKIEMQEQQYQLNPDEDIDCQIVQENNVPTYIINDDDVQEDQTDTNTMVMNLEYSPYQTKMIEFKHVGLVCETLGCLSSQFGYLQNECTYLIKRRMDKFFEIREDFNEKDYEYISRCVRGMVSLGELALREMLTFLCKINTGKAPEWIHNDFSLSAVYLEGSDDIFFYEWLEDLCGEKLQPFMIHHYRYHQELIQQRSKLQKEATYNINSKVILKSIPKRAKSSENMNNLLNDYFPEITTIKVLKKIGFKFAGCRPVLLKPKTQLKTSLVQKSLQNFNANIVIGKRKLLKPLTDKKKCINLSNFCFTQI